MGLEWRYQKQYSEIEERHGKWVIRVWIGTDRNGVRTGFDSFRRIATKSGLEEQDLHESPKKEKHRKMSENVGVHKTSPRYKR